MFGLGFWNFFSDSGRVLIFFPVLVGFSVINKNIWAILLKKTLSGFRAGLQFFRVQVAGSGLQIFSDSGQ